MSVHYNVPLLSGQWWAGLSIAAVFIALPLAVLRNKSEATKLQTGKWLGAFLLIIALAIHIYLIAEGQWNFKSSLPLQLCALSGFLSGIVFFVRNQLLFELLVYWGLPGAVHSLITPEMSHGYSPFLYFEYYVAHAGIILSSLFLFMLLGFSVRKNSWLNIFLLTQIMLLAIGWTNYLLGANYMYLCQKPIAPNPFIIGDWPWYVLGLEAAGLLHFGLVYFILHKTGKVK